MRPESLDFAIEPLGKPHERAGFCSGNAALDRYLQTTATQDRKRNIAIPYVAADRERQAIIGYDTLSMSGIALEQLPPPMARKLPKYPIVGVTLLGRLAIAKDYQGFGWGKLLLMDALYRSLGASKTTASFAVVVEAIDEAAVGFYRRFEFQAFPDHPYKLFRTMANIAQAFGSG